MYKIQFFICIYKNIHLIEFNFLDSFYLFSMYIYIFSIKFINYIINFIKFFNNLYICLK